MDIERRKKLELVMKKINKESKDTLMDFAVQKVKKEKIPFGIKPLDEFVGGGISCGNFNVVYGGKGAGKSTLALQQIADAQSKGKICCYIDLEASFEKVRAVQLGVNLEELILVERADSAEQAMDIMITLAKEKVVDYICVDSIQAMSPKGEQETKKGKMKSVEDDTMALLARKLGQFFRIAGSKIFRGKVAVLMIGQVRTKGLGSFYTYAGLSGGNALDHWMYSCLFLRHGQKADSPMESKKEYYTDENGKERYKTIHEAIGFDCVLRIDKRKSSESQKEHSEIHLPFYFESGFHMPKSLKEAMEEEEEEIESQIKPPQGETEPTVVKEPDIMSLEPQKKKKRGRPKKEKK